MDKKLLKYWKNCLLDAERRERSLRREAKISLRIGDRIPEFVLRKEIPKLFPKENQEEESEGKWSVQLAPCFLLSAYENGWAGKQSAAVEYPFLITAQLQADGSLHVPDNASERLPVFVRKFLSPNARNDRTIASLEAVDKLLGEFDIEVSDWRAYWKACEQLFQAATGKRFCEMNYADNPEILVVKATMRGMAGRVLNLYDKLLEDSGKHPLLEELVSKKAARLLPLPEPSAVYGHVSHWGQMSGEFPLSVSQRETFAMFSNPKSSRIFVVNGPPGTGKTTFLQTVIADRLVHAVLEHPDEPDLIVASSANNQAITNILKDFKIEPSTEEKPKDPLLLRWLPDLDTLGLYLSGKEEQKKQYRMMLNVKGDGFPNEYDDPARADEYRVYYLDCFNHYFKTDYTDLQDCQRFLRKQMRALRDRLETYLEVAACQQYGEENVRKRGMERWLRMLKKRPTYVEAVREWEEAEHYWKRYVKLMIHTEYANLSPAEDMAVRMDISYRHTLFWYAVHDREAEFIRRVAACREEDEGLGRKAYVERLKRLACVLPVCISTFHSLPRYMVCEEEGVRDVPLYDTIDLLIVDESGQVSPELAVPSFSLGKQAILVGDVEQIEPIWSISDAYSLINLKRFGILSSESDKLYPFLRENGFLSSSGSIMKLARKSCSFEVAGERGAFLTEHRRCVDSIIAFCNDYVYHGRLLPKRGNRFKYETLPAKGYVHVNGVSEKGKTGSVLNRAEAAAIIAWLEGGRKALEQAYAKPLHKIVAVVTPFKAQEEVLKDIAQSSPEAEALDGMTIGTVHSLQGAQCPIVIFSPVNTPGDASFFMEQDGKYNMLNVAVSRAQDHFLVFGNMNIFHPERDTPAGNLAKWLFDNPANEVSSNFIYQQATPLGRYRVAERLSTLDAHRELLRKVFAEASQRIVIVSPCISVRAIEHDQLVYLIRSALGRGVDITVYTDATLDYDEHTDSLRSEAEAGRQLLVDNGVRLVVLRGVHNKSLAVDDRLLVEGSFNWLSASRDTARARHECSIELVSPEAAQYIQHLQEELEKIEEVSVDFRPLSVLPEAPVWIEDGVIPGFFDDVPFNLCTDEEQAAFMRRGRQLGVQKTKVSASIQKVREQYPRYYESWSEEELSLLREMTRRTNNLAFFCDCLQRTPSSIRIKVEGKRETS